MNLCFILCMIVVQFQFFQTRPGFLVFRLKVFALPWFLTFFFVAFLSVSVLAPSLVCFDSSCSVSLVRIDSLMASRSVWFGFLARRRRVGFSSTMSSQLSSSSRQHSGSALNVTLFGPQLGRNWGPANSCNSVEMSDEPRNCCWQETFASLSLQFPCRL